jgi:hypothetical protein
MRDWGCGADIGMTVLVIVQKQPTRSVHGESRAYRFAMSPGKRAGEIRIQVPRHNTQPISPKLEEELKVLAKAQGVRVDPAQPGSDASDHALAQAIVITNIFFSRRNRRIIALLTFPFL